MPLIARHGLQRVARVLRALGIDEWVKADGGNAYAVSTFEWVVIGDSGATQLIIVFDTLHCG